MKTRTKPASVTAIIIIFGFSFFSCKKETSHSNLTEGEEHQATIAASRSEAESESIFNEVFDNVLGANNDVGLFGTGIFGRINTNNTSTEPARIAGCFEVSITRLVQGQDFPLRIIVDFRAGCLGRDGRMRSGQIITEYTGRLLFPGKTATTIFNNYTIDSVTVEGTLKITNTGNINLRQFTVDITGGKLTKSTGNYIKWNGQREITQIEGFLTPELHIDDVFSVSGHASGEIKTPRFVTLWASSITEPLRKRFSCAWISKGIVNIIRPNQTTNSKWAGILNYGPGTCDNKATLLINGTEHQIILN